MSPWPAASKPSNILRECSVMCAELAPANIALSRGPSIRRHDSWTEIREQSLSFFRNSQDPASAGTDLVSAPLRKRCMVLQHEAQSSSLLYRSLAFARDFRKTLICQLLIASR